jgi:DNA invertase Pin-like site-specific DNA recombinase
MLINVKAGKYTAGPILVTMLGIVDEMERLFIRERQQASIEAAKAKGIYSRSCATVRVFGRARTFLSPRLYVRTFLS